ncbi:hypothetical protein [Arthrobacter sp. GMC3]|uniref:hypothetical protein n=1 Tax=Arthrobacter sp. GMC3 TaxID=2058894 RepID=UPI0011AFF255|nr:hypothetical protein [Arthrobacter sp. GMC3]
MREIKWSGLNSVDLSEVRRRAHVMQRISAAERLNRGGVELIGWDSGSGDWAVWTFSKDGQAMLLVFDHESKLNLYGDYDVAAQMGMYTGLPETLLTPVRGMSEDDGFLMMGDGPAAMPAASGVFWFDGSQWRVAEGLLELVEARGLDITSDSGFGYCTSWYRFDGEFTPESLCADDAEDRWGTDLRQLREIFAETTRSA